MSIPPIGGAAPLLDALRVQYGPREVLGRYFLDMAMLLRARGIEVQISRDVDRVARLGADYEAAAPPVFPAMNAAAAGFGPENWFTIEGRDDNQRIAFFGASRLLHLKTSLREEVETMRLFYCDPVRQRDPADSVEVTAPNASIVTGFVALTGSYWVAPRLRGTGLARIFPDLCRYYSFTLWNIDYSIGFLRRSAAENGLSSVYGEPPPERWVRFRGRWSDDSYLGHNPRDNIESGLYVAAAEARSRATRTSETLDSSLPPSANRQGNISR